MVLEWPDTLLVSCLFVATGLSGCNGSSPSGCKANSDCRGGEICDAGACVGICDDTVDCPAGQVCNAAIGLCAAVGAGGPTLRGITGNDPNDPGRVVDALVVSGSGLLTATFSLDPTAGGTARRLAVRSQSELAAELVLPADVRSGDYLLVATNAAGSTAAPVTLTLPDLSGDLLIDRINTEGSTLIDAARLDLSGVYGRGEADGTFLREADVARLGGNYLPNSDFQGGTDGLQGWLIEETGAVPTHVVVDTSADGAAGIRSLGNGTSTRVTLTSTARVPVDVGAVYRVNGSFRDAQGSGSQGDVTLAVRLYDGGGTELPAPGTFWFAAADQVLPPADMSWQRYAAWFGAGTAQPFPAGARFMTVAAVLNNDMGAEGNRHFEVQGLELREDSQGIDLYSRPLGCGGGLGLSPTCTKQYEWANGNQYLNCAGTSLAAAGTCNTTFIGSFVRH